MSAPVPSPGDEPGSGLVVNEQVTIPRGELSYRATRAGGAGGQHVNKTSTRIELLWTPATSRALDDAARARVLEKLASRLDAEGTLRVVASDTRSQAQNRRNAEARLAELLRRALSVPKSRRKTKPGRAAREARLDEKKKRADRKRQRRKGWED